MKKKYHDQMDSKRQGVGKHWLNGYALSRPLHIPFHLRHLPRHLRHAYPVPLALDQQESLELDLRLRKLAKNREA